MSQGSTDDRATRFLSIDDVLSLSEYMEFYGSQFDLAPSQRELIFSTPKAVDESFPYFPPFFCGRRQRELCLVDLETRSLRRLAADPGLSLVSPLWSPDGKTIAAALTDGFSFVRPCVVDPASGATRVLSERSVVLESAKPFFRWLGAETLVCELVQNGRVPRYLDCEFRGALAAGAAWRQAWQGDVSTASALSTGNEAPADDPKTYCIIDTSNGAVREFADLVGAPDGVQAFAQRPHLKGPPQPIGDGHPVPPFGTVVASDPKQTIFLARCDNATRLLRQVGDEVTTIFETDAYLAEVRPSTWRTFPFKTRAGRETVVHCLMPPDHHERKCLPAVVWVYPGTTGPSFLAYNELNDPSFFNLHLLAARGFVVIYPGIPTDSDARQERELIDCVVDAVEPAIETVVGAGIVDPEHLHVAGHSLGGWASLALLTETKLFRTGIAMAAPANLIASHGETDVRFRYDPTTSDYLAEMCRRIHFLPGPPQRHLDRYVRNSPFFAVERILAPVLLMQGDQDYVSIAQSEEMFGALRQWGKDAVFVRYWGEGHVFESPANIRDAWTRIFQWLDAASIQ